MILRNRHINHSWLWLSDKIRLFLYGMLNHLAHCTAIWHEPKLNWAYKIWICCHIAYISRGKNLACICQFFISQLIVVCDKHTCNFWILTVTMEGVVNAFFMVIRILMLIAGTFLLTYTTSPILLTDGLESLLGPLKKIKVPVHELSMMMSIALRFIPTLIEETEKIISAQKARGADFDSGNLIQRAKAMIPILVPLFISAFRRADELATAMECRLYRGDVGRTRMRQLKIARVDVCALLWVAVLFAVVIILKHFGL